MPTRFDDEHDEFLQKLNAQLRRMPQADRAEIHTEVRQHLDDLAKAHEELGATTDEAERAALHQFGDPVKIGRRLFSEWSRSSQISLWRIAEWSFFRVLAIQSGIITLFAAASISITSPANISKDIFRDFFLPLYNGASISTLYLVPLLVGAWAGKRFGRRALPGLAMMSMMRLALAPVLSAIYALLRGLFSPPSPPFDAFHVEAYQHTWLPFYLFLLTGAWLAQKFDGSPRLSLAGLKSRFRR